MTMTDPIADYLTRIRNAIIAKRDEVTVPSSNIKIAITKLLKNEGYIKNFKIIEDKSKQGLIKIHLKYDEEGKPLITNLVRVSKPGRRIYVKKEEVPKVLNGLGIAVISTPYGIVTDSKARKLGVGGELICKIW
jgi:small subunit ribosomal protein S8